MKKIILIAFFILSGCAKTTSDIVVIVSNKDTPMPVFKIKSGQSKPIRLDSTHEKIVWHVKNIQMLNLIPKIEPQYCTGQCPTVITIPAGVQGRWQIEATITDGDNTTSEDFMIDIEH